MILARTNEIKVEFLYSPHETVQLQNIDANQPVDCSNTRWVWTVGKIKKATLSLYLWNDELVSEKI